MFCLYPLWQNGSFECKRDSMVCKDISEGPSLKQDVKVGWLHSPSLCCQAALSAEGQDTRSFGLVLDLDPHQEVHT